MLLFSELKYCEENSKTCMNDGKCSSLPEDEGSYKCECPSGFKGKRCEIVPILANSTVSISTPRPLRPPTPSTKLPSPETTVAKVDDDDDHTTEPSTGGSESEVVEDEILTNEA